jgi:hypothetical protein
MAGKDRRPNRAQEFRHPKPHIGRPGDDRRTRMLQKTFGQIIDIGGQDGAIVLWPGHHAPVIPERRQPRGDCRALDNEMIRDGGAIAADRLRGADDRRIAGAAAEIALKRGFHLRLGRLGHLHPERIERHDETGRAKTALAAVMIDHRLLHRVQPAVAPGKMLDRDHMAAIDRGQKPDAGIDRAIAEALGPKPPDQHGAGPAIALGAALLGAGEALIEAQEIEQGLVRSNLGQRDVAPVENETDIGAMRHGPLPSDGPCRR